MLKCYQYVGTGALYKAETEQSRSKFALSLQVYAVWCRAETFIKAFSRAQTITYLSRDCLEPRQVSRGLLRHRTVRSDSSQRVKNRKCSNLKNWWKLVVTCRVGS